MTKKEKIYNSLCERADEEMKKANPCKIIDGRCIAAREGKLSDYKTCCRRCKYLGENGCTEKILGCKIHLCGIAKKNVEFSTILALRDIEFEAICDGFHLIFAEKETFNK